MWSVCAVQISGIMWGSVRSDWTLCLVGTTEEEGVVEEELEEGNAGGGVQRGIAPFFGGVDRRPVLPPPPPAAAAAAAADVSDYGAAMTTGAGFKKPARGGAGRYVTCCSSAVMLHISVFLFCLLTY